MAIKKNAHPKSALTPKRHSPPVASAGAKRDDQTRTIGGYLIQRLQDYGLEHVFGIPGDFVLQFYAMLEESPLKVIGATREDNAGFAADAYARVHGMGAVCVTYSVGGLSMCNSIAGAYAEKSPVVVISGAPGMAERRNDPLLHHRVRERQRVKPALRWGFRNDGVSGEDLHQLGVNLHAQRIVP